MNPSEFNEHMIQFFKQFGGEGMETLHKIFRSKSNIILYQTLLVKEVTVMSEVALAEGTVHRAKTVLSDIGLIEVTGKERKKKAGPTPELWQLILDGDTST